VGGEKNPKKLRGTRHREGGSQLETTKRINFGPKKKTERGLVGKFLQLCADDEERQRKGQSKTKKETLDDLVSGKKKNFHPQRKKEWYLGDSRNNLGKELRKWGEFKFPKKQNQKRGEEKVANQHPGFHLKKKRLSRKKAGTEWNPPTVWAWKRGKNRPRGSKKKITWWLVPETSEKKNLLGTSG